MIHSSMTFVDKDRSRSALTNRVGRVILQEQGESMTGMDIYILFGVGVLWGLSLTALLVKVSEERGESDEDR